MIPIFKPYMPENVTEGINKILYSSSLSYAKYGKKFEKDLSRYIGCKNILTISSYNQAMMVLLSTLELNKNDEIIASPVSCLASNQPFATRGLKVVWADINPHKGTLCVDDVKSKITSKTKAIFHNHFCGYLGNVNEINSLGNEFGIPVIDDCIEAFGSILNNKKSGNLGTDISVFSFQTVRLPNTINGGGLVFSDDKLFEKAKKIRDYGIDRSKFRDSINEISVDCDIKIEGYGALMSELNSFIGSCQLEDISKLIKQQEKNAEIWNSRINRFKNIKPLEITNNSSPNYWVYGTLTKNKYESIRKFRDMGFYASGVHINNNIYSIFNNKIELKGVSEFISRFVALPCGWWFNLSNIE